MRNQQVIKLFLVLIICTSYIYGFSQFGVQAYDTLWKDNSTFEKGTTIGSVDVSGKSKSQASQLVDQEAAKWLKDAKIEIHFKEKTIPFDNSLITLRVGESVNQAKQGQQNNLLVVMESIDSFMASISPELSNTVYDFEKIKSAVLSQAARLQSGKQEIQLNDYLIDPQYEKENVISKVSVNAKIAENDIALLTDKLSEIELKPMSQFSLLSTLKDLDLKQVSAQSINMLATGIYQVILPTNFAIIERQISEELPKYANLGYEAKADIDKNMDLVFSNPNESSYQLKLDWKKNKLTVSLLGPSFLNQYRIQTKDKQTFKPKIIVQFNPQLNPTQKIVEQEGQEGQLIKVIRTTFDETGKLLKTEQISEDFYAPIHRIEVQGLIIDEGSSNTNTDEQTTNNQDESTTNPNEDTNSDSDSQNPDEGTTPPSDDENAQG